MAGFAYAQELLTVFPATRGAVIHATGLANESRSPLLDDLYREEQHRVRAELADTALAEIPSLSAWRATFSKFGVKPTQYRSAAEALLRRLTKQGDIPSINPLVDVANLTSIRHRLPVAVFDQRGVSGVTTVRFARGDERFTDLGGEEITHPEPGEVIFADEADLVSARRWCWRQSIQSAAGPTTTDALITVEGQHHEAEADVAGAAEQLLDLFAEYQPQAEVTWALLAPDSREFLG